MANGMEGSMMSTPAKPHSQVAGDGGDLEARSSSRVRPGNRHGLRLLSTEEKMTYRKWMRGVWILYGAVAVVLSGLVFTGSFQTAIPALEKQAAQTTVVARSK
jgi:hypothetical protein